MLVRWPPFKIWKLLLKVLNSVRVLGGRSNNLMTKKKLSAFRREYLQYSTWWCPESSLLRGHIFDEFLGVKILSGP